MKASDPKFAGWVQSIESDFSNLEESEEGEESLQLLASQPLQSQTPSVSSSDSSDEQLSSDLSDDSIPPSELRLASATSQLLERKKPFSLVESSTSENQNKTAQHSQPSAWPYLKC